MSIIIERGKDETKSWAFHEFLNMCSIDGNDTFVELRD